MPKLRQVVHVSVLVGALALTAGASGASASTFFVNGTTGSDGNSCASAGAACKTIDKAVEKAELAPDTATIEVAVGIYKEEVEISRPADNGMSINGAGAGPGGTRIEGNGKSASRPTVEVGLPEGGASLSNLSIVNPSEDAHPGIGGEADLTLNNVFVDIQAANEQDGIQDAEFGALTMNGGGVTMESKNTGKAISAAFTPLTLTGVTITLAEGAKGSGIEAEFAPMNLNRVTVNLGATAEHGAILSTFSTASLANVTINDNAETSSGGALALIFSTNASAKGLKIAMTNAKSGATAIESALGSVTLEHTEVSGAWTGPAMAAEGGLVTLLDSRLTGSPTGIKPAMEYVGASEGRGLLIQRSTLQAGTSAPEVLDVFEGNATLDSSEILGGQSGVFFEQEAGRTRTLTIAGSTIDVGVLGSHDPGLFAVKANTEGPSNNFANVNIEGSILFENQAARTEGTDATTITCSYSDVPSQTQVAKGTEGAINCASAGNGNTSSEPSALFSTPITNYNLLPGTSAIDSVPASAISLPFGLTPSATDLVGNPRVVDGNGDCAAVQDKGALELQGHSATCPSPPPPPQTPLAKPVLGVLTHLAISPSSFFAAPSGATIAKASKKAKKTYGTTIAYTDSQAATTTFTVLRETPGRKQGKTCAKPSKANKHGKSCVILKAIGSFAHTDVAGANKLHFSGRLGGKKLAKGTYKLQAVPHDTAGNGAAVSTTFKIKG